MAIAPTIKYSFLDIDVSLNSFNLLNDKQRKYYVQANAE